MQYQSQAQNQDLVSEIYKICNATANTYPINDITRRVNAGLDRFFTLAFKADSQWPFDDLNQSGAAIKTANLVSGTNSYKITGIAGSNFGTLLKVAALDSGGVSHELDFEQFNAGDFDTNYSTSLTTSVPNKYTLYGDFIYIRNTPDYNSTNGLRLFTERNAIYMLTTDTTKEPGIPSHFHWYLARYASLPFLIEKTLAHAGSVAQQILIDEREIGDYFTLRNKDASVSLKPLFQDNR